MQNKYHNKKTTVDGIEFASIKEAKRYQELKWLEKAGMITQLTLQETWILIPPFEKNGKKYRAIFYQSDFSYTENGKRIVEDTKGFETAVFKLKKKMFEYEYPNLELRVI